MKRKFSSTIACSVFTWIAACLTAGVSGAAEPNDRTACKQNLQNIRGAIESYRQAHKDLPGRLSDLVPEHLANRTALICPVSRSRGVNSYQVAKWNEAEWFDRKTTYIYEFSTNPIPKVIKGGFGRPMRNLKRAQMGLVGGRIPIVRCLVHGPVVNLGFDGEIYESELEWEKEFANVVITDHLAPVAVMAGGGPMRVIPVPPRDPATPGRLINLGDYYNASLSRSWCTTDADSNLRNVPFGVQTFAGVEFDVRGIVQLRCDKYVSVLFPIAVTNIQIGQRCGRLQFLHAAAWESQPRLAQSTIGAYQIHFDGGRVERVPIIYGRHVIDWRVNPTGSFKPAANSTVAWEGDYTLSTGESKAVYLYRTTWVNPSPDTRIRSLDLVASVDNDGIPTERTAPFLVAVTAEP